MRSTDHITPASRIGLLVDSLRGALRAMRKHPLRSALTTLGILISVAAVVVIVAIMQGLAAGILRSLDSMAPDAVIVRADTPTEQALIGQINRLSYEDYLAVRQRVRQVRHVSVRLHPLGLAGGVHYRGHTYATQVAGTDSSYQHVVSIPMETGRFLSDSDDQHRRRVAVIGPTVRRELNLPSNPVGAFIQIGGEWFRVIGLGEARGSLFGYDWDSYVYVPYSTLRSLVGERQEENVDIYFRPESPEQSGQVQEHIRRIIRDRSKGKADRADHLLFQSAESLKRSFNDILRGISLVAISVVGVSLLVGGVGIMNIMLVAVTERTREIGILKALGAPSSYVLMQFLTEAVVLSLVGAAVGLLIGLGATLGIAAWVEGLEDAQAPLWSVLLAVGFAMAAGVLSGIAPALRAARLHPVEALRFE